MGLPTPLEPALSPPGLSPWVCKAPMLPRGEGSPWGAHSLPVLGHRAPGGEDQD